MKTFLMGTLVFVTIWFVIVSARNQPISKPAVAAKIFVNDCDYQMKRLADERRLYESSGRFSGKKSKDATLRFASVVADKMKACGR